MPRTHEIRIKVSQDEFNKIKNKAKGISLTVSGLLRWLGLNAIINIETNERGYAKNGN